MVLFCDFFMTFKSGIHNTEKSHDYGFGSIFTERKKKKSDPNDEKVDDLFQSYPDHLFVDIAAVHGVQVHVPLVQGSERRFSHLQP